MVVQPPCCGKPAPTSEEGLEPLVAWLSKHSSVGLRDGALSSAHGPRQLLRAAASKEQLQSLLTSPSAVVRFYAFTALIEAYPEGGVLPALLPLANAVDRLSTDEGCYGRSDDLGSLAFEQAEQRLSLPERATLLHAAVERDAPLPQYARLGLREWPPEEALYEPLRRRVLAPSDELLPALARFQRRQDLPLIEAAFTRDLAHALQAVRAFPDPSLLASLLPIQPELTGAQGTKIGRWSNGRFLRHLRESPELQPKLDADSERICAFYRAAAALPQSGAQQLLLAPFAPDAPFADLPAHQHCVALALDADVLRRHHDIGFVTWNAGYVPLLPELDVLWAMARPPTLALSLRALGKLADVDDETAAWLIQKTVAHAPRKQVRAALAPSLPNADAKLQKLLQRARLL